jgi:hypothetical protein
VIRRGALNRIEILTPASPARNLFMPFLKGNLHTHTSFSDGALLPEEILEGYAALEYDFVALTDHDYLIRPPYGESIPANHGRLLVLKGLELEYAPLAYQHLGKIIGEEEVLFVFNHPRQYRLSVREVNRQIARIARDLPLHALEVTDQGAYPHTPEIPLNKIASDDAHSRHQ